MVVAVESIGRTLVSSSNITMSAMTGSDAGCPATLPVDQAQVGVAGSSPTDSSATQSAARRADRRLAKLKQHHLHSLHAIRHFLRTHSSYDVLPVSFRLVMFDTQLSIKSALDVMFQSGVVSAPLWRSTLGQDTEDPSRRPGFAGMITVNDIIHLIQYYYYTSSNYDAATLDVETMRLERLREIEHALNVPPPPLLWIGPLSPLSEAGELLVRTHARRVPLLDYNEDLQVESVLSVLTQYRLLKFIAMNCREVSGLKASIGSLGIGTYTYAHQLARKRRTPLARLRMPDQEPPHDAGPYWPLLTATLDTTVFDVVHMFSENGVSAVPILDEDGDVVDIYESVDVITLLRTGVYSQLDLTIGQALERRPMDHMGVACCSSDDSLASIFMMIKERRTHRMIVMEQDPSLDVTGATPMFDQPGDEHPVTFPLHPKGRLAGIICLSDLLRYIIGKPTQPVSEPTPTPAPSAPSTNASSKTSSNASSQDFLTDPTAYAGHIPHTTPFT